MCSLYLELGSYILKLLSKEVYKKLLMFSLEDLNNYFP